MSKKLLNEKKYLISYSELLVKTVASLFTKNLDKR